MEAIKLLHLAADYVQAGRDQDDAVALGIELEDRRQAIEAEWTAALAEYVDSRLKVNS